MAHIAHRQLTFQLESEFQQVLYVHDRFEAQNAHRLLTCRLFSCIVARIVIGEPNGSAQCSQAADMVTVHLHCSLYFNWEPTGSPQCSQAADVPAGELYASQYRICIVHLKLTMHTVCRCANCGPVL